MAGSIIKEITKDADGTMTVHLENGKVRGTQTQHLCEVHSVALSLFAAIFCQLAVQPSCRIHYPYHEYHCDLTCLALTVPQSVSGFDCLLGATGRSPLVNHLQLGVTAVVQEKQTGYIK